MWRKAINWSLVIEEGLCIASLWLLFIALLKGSMNYALIGIALGMLWVVLLARFAHLDAEGRESKFALLAFDSVIIDLQYAFVSLLVPAIVARWMGYNKWFVWLTGAVSLIVIFYTVWEMAFLKNKTSSC